jgi:galactose mutarotase-like enzyme
MAAHITLENDILTAKVLSKGAELFSIVNKQTGLQYMWNADPAFWAKTSPILFPIVGTLGDDTFLYKNREYKLSRHGFARDTEFEVKRSGNMDAAFSITSTPESLMKYPFDFQLKVKYELEGNSLSVKYIVHNKGVETMYFSIGGHPAFKVPLMDGTNYEDYFLLFNKVENTPRWPISSNGLIKPSPVNFLNNSDKMQLTKGLFYEDAIVLKHLRSDCISVRSDVHEHGLDFHFEGFPFFGIWAAKNANFVCLEPWCGIADSVNHDKELTTKEGIENLSPNEFWSRVWKVTLY